MQIMKPMGRAGGTKMLSPGPGSISGQSEAQKRQKKTEKHYRSRISRNALQLFEQWQGMPCR